MNIIKQLGGYEKSVKFRDLKKSEMDGEIPLHTQIYSYEFGLFFWGDLLAELLEYRREHGIYEVGDLVVSINKDTRTDVLMEILELRNLNLIRLKIISSGICGYDYSHELRHATPEEIKAGHRLP